MKLFVAIVALFSLAVSFAMAQDLKVLQALGSLPPCALTCISSAPEASNCALNDFSCLCADAQLQSAIGHCFRSSCTVKEILTSSNTTATLCNRPIRDRSHENRVLVLLFAVLSACLVLLRVVQKLFWPSQNRFSMDDIIIIITTLAYQPNSILTDIKLIPNGLGRDIWTLSFAQITDFIKYFWVIEMLYFVASALLKLSFLFFYKRIFPGLVVQRLIWSTIVINILWGVTCVIIGVFQCWPISYFWNFWDQEHSGRCIDILTFVSSTVVISIVLDIWMLVIPLSQLWGLQMSWSKKSGVVLMFCLGTVATVVTVFRLNSVLHTDRSKSNITWDVVNSSKWSSIEISVGIACSCIPSIRFFLVRLLPSVFSLTHDRSHGAYQYGNTQSKSSKNGFRSLNDSRKQSEPNTINCTTTFSVNIESKPSDEVELVHLSGSGRSQRSQHDV